MNGNLKIRESLNIKDEYFSLAKELFSRIHKEGHLNERKVVIAVGGESGSGKSITSICLQKEMSKEKIGCAILHMDSYFKLPPKENHKNRLKNLENVGPHEVNMQLLNSHLASFKKGDSVLEVPVVNYEENKITKIKSVISDVNILIVEGVYSFMLENLDLKIFMSRTYRDTLKNRIQRTRENYSPVIEDILEIEHQIVKSMRKDAEFIIKKNYTLE